MRLRGRNKMPKHIEVLAVLDGVQYTDQEALQTITNLLEQRNVNYHEVRILAAVVRTEVPAHPALGPMGEEVEEVKKKKTPKRKRTLKKTAARRKTPKKTSRRKAF
jgi:NH3-dependent NAD+ synthetase